MLRWRLHRLLDRSHGMDDGCAIRTLQLSEQRGNVATRTAVEFGKRRAAFHGQCKFGDAAVGLGRLSRHDLTPLQGLQRAAEETCIQAERASQIGGRAGLAVGNFVDDPRFLQRPRTVEQLRFDDAQLAGIEPAEGADGGDLRVEFSSPECI